MLFLTETWALLLLTLAVSEFTRLLPGKLLAGSRSLPQRRVGKQGQVRRGGDHLNWILQFGNLAVRTKKRGKSERREKEI